MISLWLGGANLENRKVDRAYDFTMNYGDSFDISYLKRWMRYLEIVHGVNIKSTDLYKGILSRVNELEFVPF